jgi:hypothetical protein
MTIDEARAVYLSFTGAAEGAHHGHPDFRVGDKIFASLFPDKGIAVLRLPLEIAEALAAESPTRLRLVSRSGGMGWLQFDVDQTAVEEFAALAELAFETRRGTQKTKG